MPDLREVFQMSTQKVRPDRGFTERQEFRQRRRTRNRKIAAYAMVAAIIAIAVVAIAEVRNTSSVPAVPPTPTGDLGIFAPVAGRIVFGETGDGPWAADPNSPSRSTLVRLHVEDGQPLGWSSDGTELLLRREDPTDQTYPYDAYLYILHADGTETQLNKDAMLTWDATIAPDGSRVVFAAADGMINDITPRPAGLYVVDVEGGQPVQVAREGDYPTFSPDGTQIAYLTYGEREGHLWVADADGSDAHEILADEAKVLDGVTGLQWSPAGQRIAMANSVQGSLAIYTVAPDGSDFTKVITGGFRPYWSPDGSQIAYTVPGGSHGHSLTIADADGSNVREFGFGFAGPWHPGESSDAAGPTTLAKGEDVELVGDVHSGGLGAQTLNIAAEEENGKATGEFRVTDNVIGVDCADTDTEGVVILGGEVTGGPDFAAGDLLALIIREGDPDSVSLYANDSGAASCTGMLKAIPDHSLTDDTNFVDVEDGYDIQTG
jgi:hypothetical protein